MLMLTPREAHTIVKITLINLMKQGNLTGYIEKRSNFIHAK